MKYYRWIQIINIFIIKIELNYNKASCAILCYKGSEDGDLPALFWIPILKVNNDRYIVYTITVQASQQPKYWSPAGQSFPIVAIPTSSSSCKAKDPKSVPVDQNKCSSGRSTGYERSSYCEPCRIWQNTNTSPRATWNRSTISVVNSNYGNPSTRDIFPKLVVAHRRFQWRTLIEVISGRIYWWNNWTDGTWSCGSPPVRRSGRKLKMTQEITFTSSTLRSRIGIYFRMSSSLEELPRWPLVHSNPTSLRSGNVL